MQKLRKSYIVELKSGALWCGDSLQELVDEFGEVKLIHVQEFPELPTDHQAQILSLDYWKHIVKQNNPQKL